MDLQTSHLAAALMSNNNSFNNEQPGAVIAPTINDKDEPMQNDPVPAVGEPAKPTTYEEKEEIGSGEEFSDEVLL